MKNAVALNHSDQVHRTEPKSYTKLKAMVTDTLDDQPQDALMSHNEKGCVQDSNPSRPFPRKVTEREEIAGSGHPKDRAQGGATCAFKHDNKKRGKGKRDIPKKTPSLPKPSTAFSKT